jgi:excisionase family DNA binding protein
MGNVITLQTSGEAPSGALPPLIAMEEASELLGITPQTVRRFIREGKLPGVKIGRRVYLQRDKFLAMAAR